MNRKLNLIGIKQLRLIEELLDEINIPWLTEQLASKGFTLKTTNKVLKIYYEEEIISIIATYTNDNLNTVKFNKLYNFPLTSKEVNKTGRELDGEGVIDAINQLIPSQISLKEDDDIKLPNNTIDNQIQFSNIMETLKNYFKVTSEVMRDKTGVAYKLSQMKNELFNINIETLKMKVFNGKYKQYDSLETIMKIIEKNLGIEDLHSQIIKKADKEIEPVEPTKDKNIKDTEEEKEINEPQNNFNRNIKLDNEAKELLHQLPQEVQQILTKKTEDYDRTNINVWNLALKKCKSDKEKDTLIELFLNKKMNIAKSRIERNFLGLREWCTQRGFDIDKNLALYFIDKFDEKYPEKEIPSGSIILLTDLSNRKIIQSDALKILQDKNSLLYEQALYEDLKNNYNDILDIVSMYYRIYNMSPITNQKKIDKLTSDFKFLTPELLGSPQSLAKAMCMNGSKLRDKDEVEIIYEALTDNTYKRDRDETADKDITEIIRDYREDKKLDNLERANIRTLNLVQDAVNATFKDNPKAANDFLNNLQKSES